MCFICHYRGDNGLVYAERRLEDHVRLLQIESSVCLQPNGTGYLCIDCNKETLDNLYHACASIGTPDRSSAMVRAAWIHKPCPKCGAKPGELCLSRGYDRLGPKPRYRKTVPCAARRKQ